MEKTKFESYFPNGDTIERRRQLIAQLLKKTIHEATSGKLLELLTFSLRYQYIKGLLPPDPTRLSIFYNQDVSYDEDSWPNKLSKIIRIGEGAKAESCMFSVDGKYMMTGSSDGFIEIWDPETTQLAMDIPYQQREQFLMHNDPVVSMVFSFDGELLASATSKGQIKIWQTFTGKRCWQFSTDKNSSITYIAFSLDATKLISGSIDGTSSVRPSEPPPPVLHSVYNTSQALFEYTVYLQEL
uniref:WD40 repeat-containing protein SMU1 n=1 Tax=Lygus hesperus TaxID=30085 RepID=A0A0A9XGI3_LYGHE